MKIFAFSIDLKLDADGQGFKILEINDGLKSGFRGYKSASGEEMFSDVMLSDYAEMFPDREIMTPVGLKNSGASKEAIYFPRGNIFVSEYDRMKLATDDGHHRVNVNADLAFLNFCTSKAFQNEIFWDHPELNGLHPLTTPITVYKGDVIFDYEDWINDLKDPVVLKPDQHFGGNGVMIIEGPYLKYDLMTMLDPRRNEKGKSWCGAYGYLGLVQELLPPNLIDIDGKEHDATMRAVVTVWQDKDGDPFQCRIHDAYWKPSVAPYQGIDDRASRISYSAAFEEPEKRKKASERFAQNLRKSFLGAALLGRPSIPEIKNPIEGQIVDDAVKSWLFPKLKEAMPVMIAEVTSRPISERVLEWLASEFVKSGWKLKPLHRLIMTSEAYRRSGKPSSCRFMLR